MRTTLKQVSEETGLSIATVSRALRRKNRNYTPNEEKIYKSARKLGYPFIGNSNISETSSIALVSEIKEGEFFLKHKRSKSLLLCCRAINLSVRLA